MHENAKYLANWDVTAPKAIFVADRIGYRSNKPLLKEIANKYQGTALIVQLGTAEKVSSDLLSWDQFRRVDPSEIHPDLHSVDEFWTQEDSHIPLCIQFTSGTTGPRKAAMLTHQFVSHLKFVM